MGHTYKPTIDPAATTEPISNVVPIRPRLQSVADDTPLTPAEYARLRMMMRAFEKLVSPTGCPVARSVLDD